MRVASRFSLNATRNLRGAALVAVLLLLAAACSSSSDPAPTSTSTPTPTSMTTASAPVNAAIPAAIDDAVRPPRPIVVDTDLGADDVMALLFLLESPAVDVRAITVSGTGLVHCDPGVRHVQSLLAVVGATDISLRVVGKLRSRAIAPFPTHGGPMPMDSSGSRSPPARALRPS